MLGTVLIGACSDENIPKDRYVYKAQQECVQDWGESNCEPSRKSSGAGAAAAGALAGAYFFGPRFNQIVETPGGKHVWSGTPDLGSSNLDKKDALIQNLARWARADGASGRGAGVVALVDASEEPAVPYSWMGQISALAVSADATILDVYDNVETRTATGVQIVMWNGLQLGYTNMASGALTAAGGSVDATGGRSTAAVLVTAAGESGPADGLASITTDKQDYSPGETVTVTGSGWLPGETVSMLLHEEPLVHGDRTLSAVADGDGKIFNNSFHPEDHDFGIRFVPQPGARDCRSGSG